MNEINLIAADENNKTILKNLFQYYLHDLSAYTDNLEITVDGLFDNSDIDIYYAEQSLIPLMITYRGKIVGFLLLNRPPYAPKDMDYYINDIFILRSHRKKGIAKFVVKELFKTYQGKYSMLQLINNKPAIEFWHKLLLELGITYKEQQKRQDEEDCLYQEFEIPKVSKNM